MKREKRITGNVWDETDLKLVKQFNALSQLDLNSQTVQYLSDIKSDPQFYSDKLTEIVDMLIFFTATKGEAEQKLNIAPEMEKLLILHFFKRLVNSMNSNKNGNKQVLLN